LTSNAAGASTDFVEQPVCGAYEKQFLFKSGEECHLQQKVWPHYIRYHIQPLDDQQDPLKITERMKQ
jgi:hypothetical protein